MGFLPSALIGSGTGLFALLIGGCVSGAPPAERPPRVTGAAVYEQGIALLKTSAVLRGRLEARADYQVLGDTPSGMSIEAAQQRLGEIVVSLNDPHARFVPARPSTPGPEPSAKSASTVSETATAHPPIPTRPTGEMLADEIGYLLLPGCPSVVEADAHAYATDVRLALRSLRQSPVPLRGVVVDLRLNGGGNVWPMLLGIRPLIGDGVAGTALAENAVQMRMGCDGDAAWLSYLPENDRTERLRISAIEQDSLLPSDLPIAVLIHQWTMSSGELTASFLRDGRRTRLFGEPTAGLTTGTFTATLDDGSIMTIPTHDSGDRQGKPLGARIEPDETVSSSEWPSSDDAVARAAMAWVLRAR